MNSFQLSSRIVKDLTRSHFLSGIWNSTRRSYFSLSSSCWPSFSRNIERHRVSRIDDHRRGMVTLRRKRAKYEKHSTPQPGSPSLLSTHGGGLEDPFQYSGESLEEYSQKATLSPWTPVPDSVGRKIFDLIHTISTTTEDERHVELGSGDGRVNFFAIEAGISQSIGIDVDEDIIQIANERLQRIHPKPNIQFIVADLMDPQHPAWKYVSDATILTMYFAKEGLDKIRPLLETSLRGKRCKIICCGYPMTGWDYQMAETVLGMTLYFYDWGNSDSIITDIPMIDSSTMMIATNNNNNLQMDKFSNKKRKSTFIPDPLRGFHPDDLVDYGWDTFVEVSTDQKKKEGFDQKKKEKEEKKE